MLEFVYNYHKVPHCSYVEWDSYTVVQTPKHDHNSKL